MIAERFRHLIAYFSSLKDVVYAGRPNRQTRDSGFQQTKKGLTLFWCGDIALSRKKVVCIFCTLGKIFVYGT
jgi:hypothetical protein